MRKLILIFSILILFAAEISRVYYIMPFPGSQKSDNIGYAYWIHNNLPWIRIILLLIIAFTLIPAFRKTRKVGKIAIIAVLILYGITFYFFNYRFQADKMFIQPKNIVFENSSGNKVDRKRLVLGVVINGEAKAYPIQVIGYHHQVRDSLGNVPLMVTYCTVCRTGRVFSPHVNDKPEDFRLVGMDHFNAMFEDATTKSWWQQATGIAVAGELKGKALKEIPFEQSTLDMWLSRYPQSLVLQPDTIYNNQYASLDEFDNGTIKNALEKRDSASWAFKSWVIGVDYKGTAKAYDWNMLVSENAIYDSIPGLPMLITLEKDTATFNVFSRMVKDQPLNFKKDSAAYFFRDINTGSLWTASGACIDGELKGEQLARVRSSQEFWHSWKTFHPFTTQFEK